MSLTKNHQVTQVIVTKLKHRLLYISHDKKVNNNNNKRFIKLTLFEETQLVYYDFTYKNCTNYSILAETMVILNGT